MKVDKLGLGPGNGPSLHHATYEPNDALAQYAAEGMNPVFYMPEARPPMPSDQVAFVRLVKLFGSRDLGGGVPCGDLGEAYEFIGNLRRLLESFVSAAGSGPYLLLGGGLCTPPLQVAHSVLLRPALEKPERRPRLIIVQPNNASADPLRQVENVQRLSRLVAMPDSGFDRLKIVPGNSVSFLDALIVAFGGEPTQPLPARAA